MNRLTFQSLAYYQFESLQRRDLQHGIFTRLGGVSQGIYCSLNLSRSTGDTLEPVRENRRRMFEAFGLQPAQSLTSWLVHSNTVRVVNHADLGQDDVHADAMVTRTRGLALTLRFADCVPVLFHDPVADVVGIAHAGWLGIVNGVLPATVATLRDALGCEPQNLRACIGPSIGPTQFEVGEDVAARIQAAVRERVIVRPGTPPNEDEPGSAVPSSTPSARGMQAQPKPHIDLWRAAESQLHHAGVREIETARLCTASNTDEWFSHRAEKGKTGRFGAVICLAA